MVTQSIIVYRNPLEAAFWESGMAFPLIVGVLAAIGVTYAFFTVFEHSKFVQNYGDKIAISLATVVLFFVMYIMR